MSDEFDANDAAARAVGKQAEGTLSGDGSADTGGSGATNHAAAEGADTDGSSGLGSTSSWREMLMETEPAESLEQIESPWQPETGGLTRMYRAIQKMSGMDGMPALGDLLIGAVEVAHQMRDQLPANAESDDVEDDVTRDEPDDQEAPEIEGVPSA